MITRVYIVSLFVAALLASAVLPTKVRAQEPATMITDRPDETESAWVVPEGWLQTEGGWLTLADDASSIGSTMLDAEIGVLARYGLLGTTELRLGAAYHFPNDVVRVNDMEHGGLGSVTVGVKTAVAPEGDVLPRLALICELELPVGDSAYRPANVAPSFRVAAEHSLGEALDVGANIGAEWDGSDPEGAFIYTLVVGLAVTDEVGMFAEVLGRSRSGSTAEFSANAGLTCLVLPWLQFDGSIGAGLSEAAPDYRIGAGLSLRYPVW